MGVWFVEGPPDQPTWIALTGRRVDGRAIVAIRQGTDLTPAQEDVLADLIAANSCGTCIPEVRWERVRGTA